MRDTLVKLSEGPINFVKHSIPDFTLQNSLAVKSSERSGRGKANAEKLKDFGELSRAAEN